MHTILTKHPCGAAPVSHRTLVALSLALCASAPVSAQDSTDDTQATTFTVAAMNVDGLPPTLLLGAVKINPDAKEEAGATGIGQKLATKDYDFVGLSEDFNYHKSLVAPLEGVYTSGTWRGSVNSLTGMIALMGKPFDTDGLGFLWKSNVSVADESWTMWTERNGTTSNGSDELISKGYRHYSVTLANGVVLDVFQLHMDAETDAKDIAARESQMAQLADDILIHYDNRRPKIVMGDYNNRYTRDYMKTKFIDVLADDGKYDVRDAWVEYCRQGIYPTYGSASLMVGDLGYVAGEIVDKIVYMNPTASNCATLSLNSFEVDTDFNDDSGTPLADHYPVTANFTATPALVTSSASKQWQWKCETAAAGSEYYFYNVGFKAFLRSDGYLVSNISDGSLWQLTAEGSQYSVACNDGSKARLALGGIVKESGAEDFSFISSTTTEGAYKLKSTYWGNARYFNPEDAQGNFSDNGAKSPSTNNDWLLVSAEQRAAYERYCEAYAEAVELLGLLPLETSTAETLSQLLATSTNWTDETTTTAIESQCAAIDEWFTDRTSLLSNPSFEEGTKLGDGTSATYVLGWTVATDAAEAFSSAVVDGDEGAAIRAFTPIDGSYVFNTWGGSPANGYFCRQTLQSLPAGYYELTATFASNDGNTVDLLFGDEKVSSSSLTDRTKGSTVSLLAYWPGGDCTVGAVSSTWFEADNFVLRQYDNLRQLTFSTASLDTASATYFSTLSLPYNSVVPEGVTLWKATAVNPSTIHLESFDAGTVLAAGTPVVVSTKEACVSTFHRTSAEADITNPSDNLLLGTPSAPLAVSEKEAGYTYYVLARKSESVVFSKLKDSARVPQYKAYLKVSADADAQLRFSFGDADAIETPSAVSAASVEAVFAPDGRRLAHPQRGLNILRLSDGSSRKLLVK